MKFAILVFPGSNCDHDCHHIVRDLLGCEAVYVWHHETSLQGADAIILPGGFAYGDYLRAGAMGRFSPIMGAVAEFAGKGGPVLGICNGFQILCEARLLPGALRVNRTLRYLCQDIHLRCESSETPWTRLYEAGRVVRMPIGHGEGNYTAPPDVMARLEADRRVVFRYCDERGNLTEESNPNGSDRAIAGIASEGGNVVGLMPHPDRCSEKILTNDAGILMFRSCIKAIRSGEELLGTARRLA